MTPLELKRLRLAMGLRQEDLAQKLKTTRMTVTRYESGTHRIPGAVEVAISQLASRTILPMVGVVAAGRPIEPVLQAETVDVPPSMTGRGENSACGSKASP
jgi:repressor LexA